MVNEFKWLVRKVHYFTLAHELLIHKGYRSSRKPFLVQEGIDSISLNPDSIMKITLRVTDIEKGLEREYTN